VQRWRGGPQPVAGKSRTGGRMLPIPHSRRCDRLFHRMWSVDCAQAARDPGSTHESHRTVHPRTRRSRPRERAPRARPPGLGVENALRIRPHRESAKGWYAAPDTAPQLLRAWRIGGRLACISALVHHGLVDANETAVHVAITTGSSRLRHPDDKRQRLSPGREDSIVLHWAPRVISAGEAAGDERMSRLVVPLEIALEQAEVCRPRTTPAWTLRRDTL